MKSFRVLGLSCLLLLTSCAEIQHFLGLDVDYFADYRSKNLLDNTGLDAKLPDGSSKWTTTSLGLNTAGVDDYMVWERVGDAANADAGNDTAAGTPAAGPDGTSPVYRVEIKNLLPNGDFETGTSLGSYWAAVKEQVPAGAGGAIQLSLATSHPDNKQPIASPVTIPVGARTISNQSLLFAAEDNQDYLYLDLKAAIGSLWLPGQYRVRFDFINTSNSTNFHIALIDSSSGGTLGPADAESSGGWLQNGLPVVSNAERRSASRFFTIQNTTDQRKLRFGDKSQTENAILDNLRVVLANQDLSAIARFPSLSSASLKLLPGQKAGAYTFTIQVKDDPTAFQGATGHQGNRFLPLGLTVNIQGKDKNSGPLKTLAREFFKRPSEGWPAWTIITVQGGLDFVDTDADLGGLDALQIELSPTNQVDIQDQGKDAGSLLVSQPTFVYNP